MIKIINGRIENIKNVIVYPPLGVFESTLVKHFTDILKGKIDVTLCSGENNNSLNKFEDVKKIVLPEKINFFKLLGLKKEYRDLKFDLSLDFSDYNHIYGRILKSSLNISIENKNADIILTGNIIWCFNTIFGFLGFEKRIERRKTKKKTKGIYGIDIELPKGWVEVKKEDDFEKTGHLWTFKNEIAAKAYLSGIDITMFLLKNEKGFIPGDIKVIRINSPEEVKKYIYEDTPYII
uniref:Uncharacterized protein n=1 Tax=candidate division WOR-3 bacterium TaxID=2052148 RepID=A0A7C4U6Q9_UNCW3